MVQTVFAWATSSSSRFQKQFSEHGLLKAAARDVANIGKKHELLMELTQAKRRSRSALACPLHEVWRKATPVKFNGVTGSL